VQPGIRLGPYEIVAPIGAGGMGEVYRARDTRLGRDVAIKVLPPEFADDPERLRRFQQEARAVAALSHPNVLAIHDVGTYEAIPYLVTELLEGESLRDRLKAGGLTVRKAVETAVQIAQGLAAAHEKGIVHRDLKPGNVFVTRDGQVKILDFGLARLAQPEIPSDPHATTLPGEPATESGAVLGTMGYTSPEQLRGERADARSDIFAFGCVLYEMLAGTSPFLKATGAETVTAIMSEDPAPLSGTGRGIPPTLQGIVRRCLEKRAEDRFGSARDVAFALEAITGETAPAPTDLPKRSWLARHRLALAGTSAAIVVVAAVAIWRPWHGVPRSAGSVAERIPSILALPCKVYGAPEVAFLTDAVPGTISTLLAQVEGLDTKVPPSSLEVEKVKGDLTTLAELYQVSSFIVTSINTSAGGFALNVELVDAATRKVRWGKQYEGPRETYNDLARQAAEGIRLAVKPGASPVPTSTVSTEAELAFREGTFFSNRYNNLHHPPDFDAGLAAFKRALQSHPSLAVAAGQIARLYLFKFEGEGDTSGALKESESWARRALGIDPRCGEAWSALSLVEQFATHPDPERGIDYAVKAVAFAPRSAWVHEALGMWVSNPGSASLFVAASLRSFELDPFLLNAACNAAAGLCCLGRPSDALPVVDRALLVQPDVPYGLLMRGFVLTRLGRSEEAKSTLRRCQAAATASYLLGELWRQIRFALAVAQRDNSTGQALARQILASVLDSHASANLIGNATNFAAPALARMGRKDDAIGILERSVEIGVPPPYDWLLIDPDIQLLRGDPRFAKVLAASREGAAMVARVFGQSRTRGELPPYLNQPLDELVKLLKQDGGTS